MSFLTSEKKTEQLNSKFWRRCLFHNSSLPRIGQVGQGYDICNEEEGPKKRFQYCLDPDSAETLLYFRAIQDHSGGNQIDPTLQDNVMLPSDFAEYIYHVGSSNGMHSIVLSGLIPGGKDVKSGRQTVFFTTVNPCLRIYTSGGTTT